MPGPSLSFAISCYLIQSAKLRYMATSSSDNVSIFRYIYISMFIAANLNLKNKHDETNNYLEVSFVNK